MFLYNNPHIKGFNHGGEHWMDILGNEVDPANITDRGQYFKTDANGVTTKHIYNDGKWLSGDNNNSNNTSNNTANTSNTSANTSNTSTPTETEEKIYADHDGAWDYKMIDGIWYTRKKETTGEWVSLESNEEATNKLNTAYPEAINIDNSTKDEEKDKDNEIDKANKKVEEGTNAVYYDEEFRSPDEANLLSGIGDTGLFDLIKAIDTTAGSFKKENYYDPGNKWDYMKADFKNTTDEDLFIDEKQFMKTPHKAGKFLIDEEQQKEQGMQTYLDQRHKNNPDKYSKVKDFDIDLYNKTGHLDFRKGLFNRKHEGFQGDLLENKYSDASHIGWELDDEGNYNKAFDYLTQNPDDETMFDQQDFDDGFSGLPLDPNKPNNYNYSDEYLQSSKHNPNLTFLKGDNPNINPNLMGDNRFSKMDKLTYYKNHGYPNTPESPDFKPHVPGKDPTIDYTNPEEVINANDKLRNEEAIKRQQDDQANFIENQVKKSQGMRYGGSLPQFQKKGSFNLENQDLTEEEIAMIRGMNYFPSGFENNVMYPKLNNLDDYWKNQLYNEYNYVSKEAEDVEGLASGLSTFANLDVDTIKKIQAEAEISKELLRKGIYQEIGDVDWKDKMAVELGLGAKGMRYGGDLPKAQNGFSPLTWIKDKYEGVMEQKDEANKEYEGYNISEKHPNESWILKQFLRNNKDYALKNVEVANYFGMPDGDHIEEANRIANIVDIQTGETDERLTNFANRNADEVMHFKNVYEDYDLHKGSSWTDYVKPFFSINPFKGGRSERKENRQKLSDVLHDTYDTFKDDINYHYVKGRDEIMDNVNKEWVKGRDNVVGKVEDAWEGTKDTAEDVWDWMTDWRDGGELIKAQNGLNELNATKALYDLNGRCYNDGCAKRWYDSVNDLSMGLGITGGKMGDDYTGSGRLWGGYSFNPSPGGGSGFRGQQQGLSGYFGGNIGGRLTLPEQTLTTGNGDYNFSPFANAVGTLGYRSEWKPKNDYVAHKTGYDKNPLQYGLGAYYTHPLMGDQGATAGGYGHLGNVNIKGGYNFGTNSPEWSVGLGIPIRKQGGSLPRYQFAGSPFMKQHTGWNPSGNQLDPIDFNTTLNQTPFSMDMFNNQTQPPEKTEPFFSTEDNMYAMNQSVNRSMDSWDAFSANMNQRIQNPSLQMNQVDTNPLSVPDFSNPELDNQIQMNQDRMAFKTAREDDRVIGNTIIPTKKESKQQRKEFGDKLQETIDDGPFAGGYKGKRKHVKELEKANELGFDDRNEYLDFEEEENKEDMRRKLRERKLNKDNKDGMSFADKLWNTKNRALDSKVGQTYGKIGAGAVRIAKPLNRMLESWEEDKRKQTMMDNAYLSDNMWAATDADITGSKGDYDVNTGIFRPDDKVTSGTTMTKYGGSFFNDGGEMEIDMNTYKQLIAAGAQIEII